MTPAELTPRPVIIDTDGGVDDALALIMALKAPQLDLQAVTVLAGNIDVDQAATNVQRVLSIVAPSAPPIVSTGCVTPLRRPPFHAAGIHGADGLGELHRFTEPDGRRRYPPLQTAPAATGAIDLLIKAAQKFRRDLTVIALGPLTNIATALQQDRTAMQAIGRLVVMGGAVTVPGNITPAAEFNFFVDPHAAQMVLESGIPITLVGLDVAMQAPLSRQAVETNLRQHPSKMSQFIADCTEMYMAFYRDNEGFHGCYLHDPLAVGVAIDPSLVTTKSLYVVVESEGTFTLGMSLADQRARRNEHANPPNVEVCLEVDTEQFHRLFDSLINAA